MSCGCAGSATCACGGGPSGGATNAVSYLPALVGPPMLPALVAPSLPASPLFVPSSPAFRMPVSRAFSPRPAHPRMGRWSRRGGSRLIVFADNQVMACDDSLANVVAFTDPVPMDGADRVSAQMNVHYNFGSGGGGDPSIDVISQTSLDGVDWTDGALGLSETGVSPANPMLDWRTMPAAFLRFRYLFAPGSGTCAVCFDLHVRLDRA